MRVGFGLPLPEASQSSRPIALPVWFGRQTLNSSASNLFMPGVSFFEKASDSDSSRSQNAPTILVAVITLRDPCSGSVGCAAGEGAGLAVFFVCAASSPQVQIARVEIRKTLRFIRTPISL